MFFPRPFSFSLLVFEITRKMYIYHFDANHIVKKIDDVNKLRMNRIFRLIFELATHMSFDI